MRSLVPLHRADLATLACPWCGAVPTRGDRGFAVVREGRAIGALVLAPGDRDRDLCPPGASVIERLWVAPADLGEHVGTQLVQRACALLVAERARCLVAYGTRGRPDCGHLPAAFLDAVGFSEHVDGVQWRIDLRRTLPLAPLRDAAGAALRLVRGTGRPLPASRVRPG
nr:GNAT family N-acetyltransferase [Propionibacterium sp.]